MIKGASMKEFFQKARVRENIKTVIFLGGSQGARAINDFALEIASAKPGFISGSAHFVASNWINFANFA